MNRQKLIEFVKQQHGDQVRKCTNEPYFNHLINVANMAEKTGVDFGWEIGLCHDLLEDTKCSYYDLIGSLNVHCDYSRKSAIFIANHVVDLTDAFTTEAYPYLNRSIRKQCGLYD